MIAPPATPVGIPALGGRRFYFHPGPC